MFKILPFIISLLLIDTDQQKNHQVIAFPSDSPVERSEWEHLRLVDPNTGEIPKGIRKKERTAQQDPPLPGRRLSYKAAQSY